MAKIYSYPRVNTSVTALVHSSALPEAEDTTVLFVPFVSEKGPVNEVVKIHSLEEFQSTFGEIKHYVDRIGESTAFMIMNWLSAGGTIYAVRMAKGGKAAEFKGTNIELIAKEVGNYVNDFTVTYTYSSNRFSFFVRNKEGSLIERFYVSVKSGSKDNDEFSVENSEYFKSLKLLVDASNIIDITTTQSLPCTTNGSDEITIDKSNTFDSVLKEFWEDSTTHALIEKNARDIIANPLETPIDLIMDAGYSTEVKKAMAKFVAEHDKNGNLLTTEPVRGDIRAIIEIKDDNDSVPTSIPEDFPECPNVFYYWDQGFTVVDGVFSNDEIEVGPSYFLSSLIPANDIANGIQFPVAGTRRGELSDLVKLKHNPMPDDKEKLFNAHINYVEKDSRGAYFMNQRTSENVGEDKYTALAFINNSRVVCRMVHELERLGRDYLFEFNDSITLANMRSVLNKYVSNWIANRTLSYGAVEVAQSKTSNEAVDVTLNIKFTGTIEVISIDIIIE